MQRNNKGSRLLKNNPNKHRPPLKQTGGIGGREKKFLPMYYTTTTNDSVHYGLNMQPVDDISVGDIIEMTRTGKEFLVESITPSGIILKECTTYISFSRSALNERLKRNSAIHKSI